MLKSLVVNFFRSVFVIEDTSNIPAFPAQVARHILEFNITEEMVLKKLAHLNLSKSCGPDGVSPWILKQFRRSLCKPLTIIYQQSLSSGNSPMDQKKSQCYSYVQEL